MDKEVIKSLLEVLNFEKIALSIALLLLTWGVLYGIKRLSHLLAEKFPRRRLLISSIFPVFRLLAWVHVVTFIIMKILRPPGETIMLVAGASGVAIGFGAQDLIKNVLAGILILFERPFRVGDMIKVENYYGEVTNVGLRASRLHTFDDSIVTLPNSMLLNNGVSNSNTSSLYELIEVKFSLPATVDAGDVKAVAREAALCSPYVHRGQTVNVLVEDEFERAFLTVFTIQAYTIDVRFERLMASDLTERVKEEINKRGLLGREPVAEALSS